MIRINRFLRRMQQTIEQQGWATLTVSPADGEPDAPFAYTVGLTAIDRPEFIMVGIHPAVTQHVLDGLARRVVEGADRFTAGEPIKGLLDGYDAVLVEGPATAALRPTAAYARYDADRVRLWQVVWPDVHGRFPWEPNCIIAPQAQPLIGRP